MSSNRHPSATAKKNNKTLPHMGGGVLIIRYDNVLQPKTVTRRINESGVGQVVKLLACGARGLGVDSPPRHLNFRDWLSPASKSRYG